MIAFTQKVMVPNEVDCIPIILHADMHALTEA